MGLGTLLDCRNFVRIAKLMLGCCWGRWIAAVVTVGLLLLLNCCCCRCCWIVLGIAVAGLLLGLLFVAGRVVRIGFVVGVAGLLLGLLGCCWDSGIAARVIVGACCWEHWMHAGQVAKCTALAGWAALLDA